MTETCITVAESHDGAVVELRLGPPPGNIVTMALVAELSAHLERIDGEPSRKLVLISGTGKHFSYGASVEEHAPDVVGEMLPRFHALIGGILNMNTPTAARVTGMCLGGGFELAMACGMMFAGEGARFGVPEIQLGVFPPVASVLLPGRIGEARAAEMTLGGGMYTAADLHRMGLVNQVAADDALDDAIAAFVDKHIVTKSASSLRAANRAVRAGVRAHYQANITAAEKLYLDDLMSTADAVEGIKAFLEKRPPEWRDA